MNVVVGNESLVSIDCNLQLLKHANQWTVPYRIGVTVPKLIESRPPSRKIVREMYTPTVPCFSQPPTLVPRFRPPFPSYRKHGYYGSDKLTRVLYEIKRLKQHDR